MLCKSQAIQSQTSEALKSRTNTRNNRENRAFKMLKIRSPSMISKGIKNLSKTQTGRVSTKKLEQTHSKLRVQFAITLNRDAP